LTGPEQGRAKLVEIWHLTDDEAAAIFRNDRALCVAFIVHGDLDVLFQDWVVELRWMRTPREDFDGRSPIEMMMVGREDEVKELLEWLSCRR